MDASKKTSQLIDQLARDLKNPSETKDWPRRYWLSWLAWFFIMASLTLYATYWAPELAKLPSDPMSLRFWIECALWLVASVLSAYCAYRSSFPTWHSTKLKTATALFLTLLAVSAFVRAAGENFAQNFPEQAGIAHGQCGFFILVTGMISSAWMFFVIRRAAPTRLLETGLWSAASAGSAGITFMHTVCRQENPIHLLLWHVLPFLIIATVGSLSARKLLRW